MIEKTRTPRQEAQAPAYFGVAPVQIQDYPLDPFGRFWVTQNLSPKELERACDRVSEELYCSRYLN